MSQMDRCPKCGGELITDLKQYDDNWDDCLYCEACGFERRFSDMLEGGQ